MKTKLPPITAFRGKYRFLSNFYPVPIYFDGVIYPTVEHAYQAAKTFSQKARRVIAKAETPGEAKHIGRSLELRPLWEKVKLDTMRSLLFTKFGDDKLFAKLVATQPAELIEVNTWGDIYWGVCRGVGQNNLGKLLMEIRESAT